MVVDNIILSRWIQRFAPKLEEQMRRHLKPYRRPWYVDLRISELCRLCWRDLAERDGAGQVTVYGKGGKTRVVLLSAGTWTLLAGLRGGAEPDGEVFRSRKGGGPLDESAVHRIVKAAAARAGLSAEVSAHWLRHAHASHSFDRGAPIHLVQATLGHASVATTGRYPHARPTDSSARYLGV